MSTLTLYRGDSSYIKDFDVSVTDKNCLWGRGIYLTTDSSVAETYRSKDLKRRNNLITAWGTDLQKVRAEIEHTLWCRLDRFGNLLAERRNYSKSEIGTLKSNPIVALSHSRIMSTVSVVKREGRDNVYYTLEIRQSMTVGHVSKFEFDANFVNRNVIHVDDFWPGDIRDVFISEIDIGNQHELKNVVKSIGAFRSRKRFNPNRIRTIFEKYGYIGLSHNGGVVTNGKRHKVYVLWDSDFVNSHRVK